MGFLIGGALLFAALDLATKAMAFSWVQQVTLPPGVAEGLGRTRAPAADGYRIPSADGQAEYIVVRSHATPGGVAAAFCPACGHAFGIESHFPRVLRCPECGQRMLLIGNAPEERHVIPGLLSLELALNTGGLFGLGSRHTSFFIVFSAATMGLVFWMFLSFGHRHPATTAALALVLGGAVGNLSDRLRHGAVRDFILVYLGRHRWPNFNVADIWICVGVAFLVLWLWTHPHIHGARPQSQTPSPRTKAR